MIQIQCDSQQNQYGVHRPACAGLVWVWPGIGEAPEVPTFSPPPQGYTIHSEIEVRISCCAGLRRTRCAAHVVHHHGCRSDVVALSPPTRWRCR
jgi:hypothetical protein